MARLGQLLREAREKKACSWSEIEAATGLWPEYAQALEREDYGKFASVGHFKSALRLYARYLGLDARHVLSVWERTTVREDPRRRTPREQPPRQQPPRRQPRTRETRDASPGPTYRAVVSVLVATLAIAIFAIAGLYGLGWLRSARPGVNLPPSTGPGGSSPSLSPTPLPSPTPYQPISSTSLPLYTMTASVDYTEHSVNVQERIDYANRSGETLDNIVLNVFPNYEPGIFTLHGLTLEFGSGPLTTTHSLEELTLYVPLPQPLEPGRVATLLMEYTLDLPYIDPQESFTTGSLGWSERVLNVGHWYPALAPKPEDGDWYTFSYHPIGDPYVMEEADYDVSVTAPAGVTLVGSGEEEREGNLWHYRISQARSFAFAASDEYTSSTVDAADITVTSYYFPEHDLAGVEVARVAAEALETYSEEFGVPYPYAEYRVAETEFAGGMEFSGMSFLGSLWYDTYAGGVRSQLISLLAHEVSHQWWYGMVGNNQVMEPWLDESLAMYSELQFYNLRYPDDHLWVWDFEVYNWQPSGDIDGSIYDFQDQGSYMDAVYRRGALFLVDLRQAMGSQDFRAFIKDYCQSQSHTLSTSTDFFSALSKHWDEELSDLLDEYFARPPAW